MKMFRRQRKKIEIQNIWTYFNKTEKGVAARTSHHSIVWRTYAFLDDSLENDGETFTFKTY